MEHATVVMASPAVIPDRHRIFNAEALGQYDFHQLTVIVYISSAAVRPVEAHRNRFPRDATGDRREATKRSEYASDWANLTNTYTDVTRIAT